MDWRIEDWYVSGVHTGWRIVRGSGWNLEVDSAYVVDIYIDGDRVAKWKAVSDRFVEINA